MGCSTSQDMGNEEVKDSWGPATENSPDGHCFWEGAAHQHVYECSCVGFSWNSLPSGSHSTGFLP